MAKEDDKSICSKQMLNHVKSQVGGQNERSPIPPDYSRDDKPMRAIGPPSHLLKSTEISPSGRLRFKGDTRD